jgi:hypothetical protein
MSTMLPGMSGHRFFMIARFHTLRQHWDVNDINLALFEYDQPLIGRLGEPDGVSYG